MWARRPLWADGLLAEVEDEFTLISDGEPGWPDPHETGDSGRLAYSVCSDPGKYRILDQRVEAWGHVLVRRDLAELSIALPGADWVGLPHARPITWTARGSWHRPRSVR